VRVITDEQEYHANVDSNPGLKRNQLTRKWFFNSVDLLIDKVVFDLQTNMILLIFLPVIVKLTSEFSYVQVNCVKSLRAAE
jgi:hypothetical protein